MRTSRSIRIIVFFLVSFIMNVQAQAEFQFNGVQLDESLEIVSEKLKSISKSTKIFNVEKPSFPLAKDHEAHLVCRTVTTKYGTIDKMVFTFADDKLSYIEAHGNTEKTLLNHRKDTAQAYLDYKFYQKDLLIVNSKKDIVWILKPEAAHVNLFTWENPYLNTNQTETPVIDTSGKIPAFIKMGASIDELKPSLEANSKFTNTEELDGSDPNAQVQINCFGVNYGGFPRKFELRFGDNKLNVVWILTGKGEENRIRQELIKHYGQPIFTDEAWEIYDDWQIGLRLDKPEVLVMTKAMGQFYKKEYFKQ